MTHARDERLDPPWSHHARWTLLRLREAVADALAGVTGPGRALDVGCGSAPYRPLIEARGLAYLGADLPGSAGAQVQLGPRGELPDGLGAFELACSFQVLEHVEDPHAHLARLREALVPEGRVLISTHGTWPYHPHPTDYWRWTREGLRLELDRAGLAVEAWRGVLGPIATGLQLSAWHLRLRAGRRFGPIVAGLAQPVIGLADRVDGAAARADDAAIWVVLARRS